MNRSKAYGSLVRSSRSFGFVPLSLLACCATACGSSGGTNTNGSMDATSGDDSNGSSSGSGSGSTSSSSSSSSGSGSGVVGDDSGSNDGSGSSSGADGGSGGEADGGDASGNSGEPDGGDASSNGGGGGDGGDASSSSGGTDGGDASSSSGGGSDGGDASSSGGGVEGGDASSSSGGGADGGDASSSGGADSGDAGSGGEAGDTGTTCNLTGAWALKVDVQVTWPATTILAAGSGTVNLYGLVQGTQSGNTIPGTLLPCAIDLPDFYGPSAVGSPTFGVTFPDSLFDGTYLTATSATVDVSSSSPGATFTSPSEANLIGITFANPATAAWPNYTTAQADAVDVVGTTPGVTATSKVGQTTANDSGTYSAIPVGVFGPYADQLYMVLRSVVALNGTLTSCTQASGNASVSHLEDHTIGCHLAAGGTCTSTGPLNQASFVDSNSPAFVVSSATFQAQMLTNAATCPNVRAAIP
jgi:hypothetical protein